MCVCLCVCWLLSCGAIAFVESKHHVIILCPRTTIDLSVKLSGWCYSTPSPSPGSPMFILRPEQYTSGYLLLRFGTVCKEGASEKPVKLQWPPSSGCLVCSAEFTVCSNQVSSACVRFAKRVHVCLVRV